MTSGPPAMMESGADAANQKAAQSGITTPSSSVSVIHRSRLIPSTYSERLYNPHFREAGLQIVKTNPSSTASANRIAVDH